MQGARCTDCDYAFHQTLSSIHDWRWRALGLLMALPLFPYLVGTLQSGWRHRMQVWGAFPTGIAMFEAAWMTAIVGLAIGSLFLMARRRVAQQSFLGTMGDV